MSFLFTRIVVVLTSGRSQTSWNINSTEHQSTGNALSYFEPDSPVIVEAVQMY